MHAQSLLLIKILLNFVLGCSQLLGGNSSLLSFGFMIFVLGLNVGLVVFFSVTVADLPEEQDTKFKGFPVF